MEQEINTPGSVWRMSGTASWMRKPEIMPFWMCYSNKEELTEDVLTILALPAVTTRQGRSAGESRLLFFFGNQ